MKQNTRIAKIPVTAGLNLEEARKDKGNFFESDTYDMTLLVCQLLFGGANVKYDDSNIWIKDKINLTLSLSWNECKIYFYSYILPPLTNDTYEFTSAQYTFRFFQINEILNYLLIKRQENEFIRENEG